MGVNVKVDYENLPQDAEVEIPYLGVFENGSSREVEDSRWERFLELQPGARDQFGDSTSVEFSTAEQQRVSEAHRELSEAVEAEGQEEPESTPLSERNKSQLKELADKAGVDVKGMSKDEMVDAIQKASGGQTIPEEEQEGK